MRTPLATAVSAALLLLAGPAEAQVKGPGTGTYAWTSPVTKDAGPPEEKALVRARDEPYEPRHGLFGAPGAAPDAAGPSRLGPLSERAWSPSYGENEQGPAAGESYATWKSGARIRSWSSADVRSARQQQAPDLEWVAAGVSAPAPDVPPAASQPQEPYGKKFQKAQQKPRR